MKINDFSEILKQLLEERLNRLNELINKKYLGFDSSYSFSNLLRYAETPTHFIGELLGTKKFEPTEKISIKFLQGKSEKISTTNSYFMPFSKNIFQPVMNVSGIGNTLKSLLLITNDDYLTLQKLPFPIPLAKINRDNGDYPLNIADSVDLLILKDVTLINIPGFFYSYRYIPFALITKKNVIEQNIKNRMDIDFQLDMSCLIQNIPVNYITGISYCYSEPNTYVSSQLISFSNQIVKEPYIDKYIQEHKSIFADALGYKDIRKILLESPEKSMDEPQGIPDFVLIKKDNSFDILDLKTGAIKLKSLTKGKKLRRGQKIRTRFVDYVSELISQLDGYKKYFEREENIQFIKNKYGLDVDLANMKLIGIVGNQNNFDTGEVDSALRPYKSHIKIVSYYDLASMILRYDPTTTLAISN